ncbi:MAG: MFS transporter [Pseudomonadota bacterium]
MDYLVRHKDVLGLAYLSAVGALFFNLQPVMVGALADVYGFDEQALGTIVAAGLLSSFAVLCSAYFWAGKVSLHKAVPIGLGLGVISQGMLAFADSYQTLVASFICLGAAMPILFAPTLIALGQSSEPQRAFGIAITVQVLLASVGIYVIPAWIFPVAAIGGIAVFFAGMMLLGFLALMLVEVSARTSRPGSVGVTRYRLSVACFAGMAVYFFGINGAFAFLERMGKATGLAAEQVGFSLSLSLLVGVAGSLAATRFGRLSTRRALMISSLGYMAFLVLMSQERSFPGFLLALCLFNVGWNFSLPFLMTVTANADPSGRFLALLPAAQTLGGALGPMLAGTLLVSSGEAGVHAQLAVAALVAFAGFLWVDSKLNPILR